MCFFPAIDVVDDENLVWLVLVFGGHLGVVESFFLEVVGEVALAFLHKVAIDSSFGINWDELLHLATGKKWNRGQACAYRAHRDNGA